jgi:hypothetical protein
MSTGSFAQSGSRSRATPALPLRIWSRLAGRTWLTPRFDPIFKDRPSLAWLQMNFDAFQRFHGIWPRAQDYRRKWVLIMRNPLRILMSQQTTGKRKWRVTQESAEAFMDGFERSRATFRERCERFPGAVAVVSIEQFAAKPEAVLEAVCSQLGIPLDVVSGRPKPEEFLRRLSRTGERPVVQGDYLKSPTRPISVLGWGGGFNPIAPLNPDRLYERDTAASLTADVLEMVRRRIGPRAFRSLHERPRAPLRRNDRERVAAIARCSQLD